MSKTNDSNMKAQHFFLLHRPLACILFFSLIFSISACRTEIVTQQGRNYNQYKVMKYDKVKDKTRKPKTKGTRQKQY